MLRTPVWRRLTRRGAENPELQTLGSGTGDAVSAWATRGGLTLVGISGRPDRQSIPPEKG